MNSNFEWQKQMSNERVQSALREAEEHFRARAWHRRSLVRIVLTQLLLGGAGLILIVVLISGCTPVSPALQGKGGPENRWSQAEYPLPHSPEDLMQSYAPQQAAAAAETGSLAPVLVVEPWSMATRIRFHDRLLDGEVQPIQSDSPFSMADRIRFHDHLENGPVIPEDQDIQDLANLERWGLEDRY